MSDKIEGAGSCMCGAIKFSVKGASPKVGACHCNMCRKWSGGPWMAVDCGSEVDFEGEEQIGRFSSSMWAERGFCKTCGTNLFYRLKGNGQYLMSSGLFSEQTGFTFDHQVFIDEKPPFYEFANETSDMTGAEVFAKYAPK